MKPNKQLKELRHDFSKAELSKSEINKDPFIQFSSWLDEAVKSEVLEPIATTISTVSKYGQPSSRIVYIREITSNGLIFFTNYLSRKGNEIGHNPKACLNFFWPELERQVRIEGIIEQVEPTISDAYFNDRPKSSQIGAWASHQSETLESRKTLEDRITQLTEKYTNKQVDRPKHWGGYILVPHYFEFWQGRPSRLHDRIAYKKDLDVWKIERLNP